MISRREQILKLCEFDFGQWWFMNGGHLHRLWKVKKYSEIKEAANTLPRKAAQAENSRLRPILTALIEENEKLRGALDRLSKRVDDYAGSGCIEDYSYDETVKGNKDISLSDIVDFVNDALASSPLDELLEGEK